MAELFRIPLTEQIQCVEREINYRRRVYPRRIEANKMTRSLAEREIERMEAVLQSLVDLEAGR